MIATSGIIVSGSAVPTAAGIQPLAEDLDGVGEYYGGPQYRYQGDQ